jgi:hypothetical protein
VLVVTASPGWAILADAASFGVSVTLLAAMQLDNVSRPARAFPERSSRRLG